MAWSSSHSISCRLTSEEASRGGARPDAVDVACAPLARLGHAVHGDGAAAGARGSRPDEQQSHSGGGKQREHRGGVEAVCHLRLAGRDLGKMERGPEGERRRKRRSQSTPLIQTVHFLALRVYTFSCACVSYRNSPVMTMAVAVT